MIFAIAISNLWIASYVRDDSSFRYDFDFFKFSFVDTKKSRHLDYLIWTNKVRRIGAKLLHSRREFAAPHRLGKIQADATRPVREMQTEFANSHLRSGLGASIPLRPVALVLDELPRQGGAIKTNLSNGLRQSQHLQNPNAQPVEIDLVPAQSVTR